jgi:uncharacterized membrane protein HdeD (DUF308 family)
MATLWNARSAQEVEVSSIPRMHLWPSLVGGGIAQLALGAVGLLLAGVTTLVSVLVFGVLLAAGGVVELVQAFRFRADRRGLFVYLLAGIVSLLAGIALMFNPIAGALWLTLVIATLLVAAGVFRLVGATMNHVPARGWAIAGGVLTALLGVLLLIDWPASSFWSIGVIVSTNLIVTGFAHVLLGFELRHLAAGGLDRAAGPAGLAGAGPAGAT